MAEKRLLIHDADWILTMNQKRQRYRRADLLICGNTITALGRGLAGSDAYDEIVDARGKIVIPGMINVHHHCAHTVLRNIPDLYGIGLYRWLTEIYELLPCFDEETLYAATLGALGDLLKTGCTTSVEHHYSFPSENPHMIDAQILAAKRLQIRFHAMRGSLSAGRSMGVAHVPDSLVEPVDQVAADCERLIKTYHAAKRGSMLQIGLAPCWLVYETREMLTAMRELAARYGVCIHSHLADSREEYAFSTERHGCSPAEFADEMGFLRQGNYFAHCIQLTKGDMARIARNKVGVAHCPNSDMVLQVGLARLPEFLRRQIPVGIGVDGAASNNLSNMIAEVKSAYVLQKSREVQRRAGPGEQPEAAALSPEDVLYAATAGGAKVLGRSDIGTLAPGMMADFVLLDWNKLQYAGGQNDPVEAVVLSGDARMVDRVYVNGVCVVDKGILQTIDEEKATRYINRCAGALFQRQKSLQNCKNGD